jgi:hypothetical protein
MTSLANPATLDNALVCHVGDQRYPITPCDLALPDAAAALRADLERSTEPIVFNISALDEWEHGDRWPVFSFISGTRPPYRVRLAEDGQEHPDLFAAAVDLLTQSSDLDPERFERRRRAAVEVAAMVHPDALTPACSRILQKLQRAGVRGYRVDRLLREAEAAARAFRGHDSSQDDQFRVVDVLAGAPVDDRVVVPRGWSVSPLGVYSAAVESGEPMLPCPLLVTRRIVSTSDATELVELAWMRDGARQRHIVPRAQIATPRTLVELAAYGLPVTSHNAPDLVRYLADFENENIAVLPRERVTSQLGWQGDDGEHGFLWGRQLIGQDNGIDIAGAAPAAINFRGADRGEEDLVNGFHAAGTFENWREAMRRLQIYPKVRLAVCASLATPLLSVFGTPNFMVDYSGPTSDGKTTALRMGAQIT